jgi:GAF domain-containing protein
VTEESPLDAMQAFAELGRIELATTDLQDVLGRVAVLAKRTIPGATEASITLLQGSQATTAAFTGPLALHLDEKQYEVGHGPCLDAGRGGETVVIDDMESEERWPDYTPRALQHGALSSVSVGLPVQQAVTGALNIYGHRPLAFDQEAVNLAETFASYAAVALANAHLYQSTATLATQMQEAMASRAVIEQAKGIVAAQEKCTTEDAFVVISKRSQRSNRKLRDVAAEIVHEATAQPPASQ